MLRPLKEWYCDKCGELIKSPKDGYVQFKRTTEGLSKGIAYEDFAIVHHYNASPLNYNIKGCYIYDADVSLETLLGYNGMVYLLSILDTDAYHLHDFKLSMPQDTIRKWDDLFKRLQLPYYEEARRYLDSAIKDGYFEEYVDYCIYKPENLKRIIEHYTNNI